jgi:hypothetical protein
MDKQKNIFTELFDEINKVKDLKNALKLKTTEQIELINFKIDNLAEEQNEIRKEFSIFEQNQNVVKQEVKTLEILEVEFQNQISKLIDKQAK